MKAGLIQTDALPGDFDTNREKIVAAYHTLVESGADVILTPEHALSGLAPRDLLFRPRFAEQASAALEALAAETGSVPLIVGHLVPNPGEGRPFFNAAVVLQHGQIAAEIAKTLPANPDLRDENRTCQPSPSPLALLYLSGETVGIIIGTELEDDQHITSLVEAGATVVLHLGSSPLIATEWSATAERLQALAAHFHLPFVSCQPVGGHVTRIYPGGSVGVASDGRLCGMLPLFEEASGVIDLAGPTDDLPEREPVAVLHDGLILALRDFVRHSGFRSVVLGLSGGIDSAVVAALAVEALGAENVHGIAMPSEYSSEGSVNDALALASNLGIDCPVIPIQEPLNAFRNLMSGPFAGLEPDTTEENMQPRLRAMIVMSFSNKFRHLALCTGNKSELAMGYCTLYGDMAGGYAPLCDLYKTEVYALAHYLNRDREVIPYSTIEKPPSAELKPGQTDQDSLPPYELLDEILGYLIEEERTPCELAANGFDAGLVNEVAHRLESNEHKRLQAAPGPQISRRAFGPGRRVPLIHRFSDPAA